jgi:hypothetical protein
MDKTLIRYLHTPLGIPERLARPNASESLTICHNNNVLGLSRTFLIFYHNLLRNYLNLKYLFDIICTKQLLNYSCITQIIIKVIA